MRVLLEFCPNLGIFAYCFLSVLRVLLKPGSYLRAGSLLRIYGIYFQRIPIDSVMNTLHDFGFYSLAKRSATLELSLADRIDFKDLDIFISRVDASLSVKSYRVSKYANMQTLVVRYIIHI